MNEAKQGIVIPARPHPDKVVQCRVSTIGQIIDLALKFDPDNESWVYRGQSSAAWHLATTLERNCSISSDFGACLRREHEAIKRFRALTRGRLDFGNDRISWLSAMQHYGVWTRLLDFTRSFFVALFFASQKASKGKEPCDFAVWCLNLKKTFEKSGAVDKSVRTDVEAAAVKPNDMSLEEFKDCLEVAADACKRACYFDDAERVSFLRALANEMLEDGSQVRSGVVPVDLPNSNERILAQNGLFVLPANFEGFESNLVETLEVDKDAFAEGMVNASVGKVMGLLECRRLACAKIIIDQQCRDEVVKLLNAANITPRTIYSDIPGIALSFQKGFFEDEE